MDQEDKYAAIHRAMAIRNRLRRLEQTEKLNFMGNQEKIESGDPYAVGLENGLILALSIMNDKEPKFFKVKKG